jgi:hypothetical protein
MKKRCLFSCFLLLAGNCLAQVTTASISGTIKTISGQPVIGTSLIVIHEPTGSTYKTLSLAGGFFQLHNLNPGGPYTIEASFTGFAKSSVNNIFIQLGETYRADIFLSDTSFHLKEISVTAVKKTTGIHSKTAFETVLDADKLNQLPSASRNIFDYLHHLPQVRTVDGVGGAASIAGQNNRYNSFYIDGAIHNDVFGLAGSGTNGGQTGAPPISIDALEQLQVVSSPYDVSYGNFTGGGINAVTRSGSNKTEASVYYFYGIQPLTGADATVTDEPTAVYTQIRNRNYGTRVSGAITKNKLFYFISIEQQKNEAEQMFNLDAYKGNTHSKAGLQGLIDFTKKVYGYDMGDYSSATRSLHADRIALKLDYTINNRHRLSISYRYNDAETILPGTVSSTRIHFSNDAAFLPNQTISISAELKSIGKKSNNRLLITGSDVKDDRSFIGEAFPRVLITDGSGSIVFGAEPNSTQNRLVQKNFGLTDLFRFRLSKHAVTTGIDFESFSHKNLFIQNSFGTYRYSSVAAFITNAFPPFAYERGFSVTDSNLTDQANAAANFKVIKTALFISDELRVGENLVLTFGIRSDYWKFLSDPATDHFFNDSALPKLRSYYDVKNARSGQAPKISVILSPRLGFIYKIPDRNITLRGGAGIFSGRMPLAWPGAVYNNNGLFTGNILGNDAPANPIRFRWNPDHTSQAVWYGNNAGAELTKGSVNLVSADLSMPSLWRGSLAIDKRWKNGWSITGETIYSKNIHETNYTNINILPPTTISKGPGSRYIYSMGNWDLPARIPVTAASSNPYETVILLSNNDSGAKGFAYSFMLNIDKKTNDGFSFNASYSFGKSMVWHEGTSSVNTSQWANMESVNGRNYSTRSVSDFNPGHKVSLQFFKKIKYSAKKLSTTFSLAYTAQNGPRISFVYSGKAITGDAGVQGFYDLIYIPAGSEIAGMLILPNTVDGVTYSVQQQKQALDIYIERNKYLREHRGQFAERNGSCMPFSHQVNFKIIQDFLLKAGVVPYRLQLSFDIFNLLNLISRKWGQFYSAPYNQVPLIEFAGYTANWVPQYRFNPELLLSSSLKNTSSGWGQHANWGCQLGLRLLLN